jgi:hypothetical protein
MISKLNKFDFNTSETSIFSTGIPNTLSRSAFISSLEDTLVVEIIVDLSTISIWLAVFEFSLINLTTNPALSANSMLLAVFIYLTKVSLKSELVGFVHNFERGVHFDLFRINPSLKRSWSLSLPFWQTVIMMK